jgi:hypothetical protein
MISTTNDNLMYSVQDMLEPLKELLKMNLIHQKYLQLE